MIDAPLAETAIVGACTGAAMMGLRPVAEMQFADFISCCWDHLVTIAAKQHWRTGASVPIVVRCPSGGGFSGGPFHSQNPESSFAHIPGLKIVCPSTPADAKGLLIQSIRDENPVLYFEHKHLYRRIKDEVPEGDVHRAVRRGARRTAPGDDLTVVTWGAMVHTACDAAERAAADARHLGRGHRPAHDHPVGSRGGAGLGRAHRQGCSSCTRTRAPPASAPRSRRRSPRRSSRTSTRPSCG